MNYFRASTSYHLLLILLMVKKEEKNILILNSNELDIYRSALLESNLFLEIYFLNSKVEYSIYRKIKTVIRAMYFQVFSGFYKKVHNIYTSQHNIEGKFFGIFLRSKNIIVFEDGYTSYNLEIDGTINSLYLNFSAKSYLKKVCKKYFLHIENPSINNYVYTSLTRLKESLPEIFYKIRDKIIELPLEKTIRSLSPEQKKNLNRIYSISSINTNTTKKTVCILTQPLVEDGKCSKEEITKIVSLFEIELSKFNSKDYDFYLKNHPREKNSYYNSIIEKFNIKVLNKNFPFELLHLGEHKFSVGITYYSTSIDSGMFEEKIILKKKK